MKIYKVTYYMDIYYVDDFRLYVNSKKQAVTLARAYMTEPSVVNRYVIAEVKGALAMEKMRALIMLHHGEEQLLKSEIDDANRSRIRFGLEPIKQTDIL